MYASQLYRWFTARLKTPFVLLSLPLTSSRGDLCTGAPHRNGGASSSPRRRSLRAGVSMEPRVSATHRGPESELASNLAGVPGLGTGECAQKGSLLPPQ